MKKIITVLALAGTLALGACAVAPLPPVTAGPVPVSTSTNPTIEAVQNAAARACGFLPTVSTVTGIIASFFPGGAPINQIATSVASAICNAVAPTASGARRASRSDGPPTVAGVRVEGYFTR